VDSGGFIGERGPARQGPGFEPPADPGAGGPSVHGLSLVARIMRGRELAAEAAGIPPLDSDQVLDLQRTAGNRLTAGALTRWVDSLPAEASIAQELLGRLFVEPTLHDAICAALDALEPTLVVHLTGPDVTVTLGVHGPQGGAAFDVTPPQTIVLPFNALFGPAQTIESTDGITLKLAQHTLELPVPFTQPAAAGNHEARAELV
jgi:hypothetical protein